MPASRKRIVSRGPKPVTLVGIRPNAGLEAAYRRKLLALVSEMNASLIYWLGAAYNQNTPEMAQDASPSAILTKAFARLSRRWMKRFDEAAPKLATWFATAAKDRCDSTLKSTLKDAGWTVELKLSAPVNDVLRASITENVALIKSIASQHLTQVETLVMRSAQQGGDLATLKKSLLERYDISAKRAGLITRDQNSKATAAITRARQTESGIDTAIWVHSHAGKTPRPSHQAMDGKTYSVKDGVMLDGEKCWPGTAINCRCFSRPVLSAG